MSLNILLRFVGNCTLYMLLAENAKVRCEIRIRCTNSITQLMTDDLFSVLDMLCHTSASVFSPYFRRHEVFSFKATLLSSLLHIAGISRY